MSVLFYYKDLRIRNIDKISNKKLLKTTINFNKILNIDIFKNFNIFKKIKKFLYIVILSVLLEWKHLWFIFIPCGLYLFSKIIIFLHYDK